MITAKDNVIRPIKNAGQAHDGLLGKLYAADAGFNLHDAVKTYKNIGDVEKGITLDVSIGRPVRQIRQPVPGNRSQRKQDTFPKEIYV